MTPPATPRGPHGGVTCVAGRTFCLSTASGQIRPGPYGDGVFVEDTRVLSSLVLTLDGQEPHALGSHRTGPGAARFSACVHVDGEADPTLLVERTRTVTDGWHERVRITSHRMEPIEVQVAIEVAADFAYIFDVKHGRDLPLSRGRLGDDGIRFTSGDGEDSSLLTLDPMPDDVVDGTLSWHVALPPRGSWTVALALTDGAAGTTGTHAPAEATRPTRHGLGSQARLRVSCSDVRFERLVEQSMTDLESLLIRDGEERYHAAGSPWFLTLFGRDSLWSAMMALPLGTEVAGETLRLLARRQGVRHDPVTEEAPGKILHELRSGNRVDRGDLPPVYYGTIDATPLFVIALERAWRWGLDRGTVDVLLPHLERALGWMRDDGAPDGGFLRYEAEGRRRLANQGWKDSDDGICFADGRLADPPIALCEVQGYAHRAAIAGAAVLDAHGRPGGEQWRAWAARLRDRFQAEFWVDDEAGGFPALAIDGAGRQVDAVTSNPAHLLATGILDPDQEALVAARIAAPDMDAGWGLRTLSSASPRFNPLAYHGGSIWPHDTAIAVDGLARTGAGTTAAHLLHGLVAAGDHFDHRLPELFGGEQRTDGSRPLPYPSACSPQAWSAGAALLLLQAILGIDPDLPNRVLHLRPMEPFPYGRLVVTGIPLAGGTLGLAVENGVLQVLESPEDVEVVVHGH